MHAVLRVQAAEGHRHPRADLDLVRCRIGREVEVLRLLTQGITRREIGQRLSISENTVRFHGGRIAPLLTACAQIATHSSAPLAIHLDHFQDVTLVDEAIETVAELGGTSIMVDAAHLPYRDNVDRTRTFAKVRIVRLITG